ncbi:hypothetical protein GCM10023172_16750 [Hymenobacter ginsengisoli]|uniref:Glycosyltransferase RgtA/B/C/D-like domain-containing protein n=1 Tax=Hymenobacter ginsengisoli TaxID=1051626 RepID=A0ABP8QA89_9BACT|nr:MULTISPECIES: hypothetical protein [unclassified Hymenobacter]MBO2030780.1 hypothetical protein [Hymenobacter sp. BT559]
MRFLLRFHCFLLLGAAGGLTLLVGLRGYASLAQQVRHPRLGGIFFGLHRDVVPAALTPGRYQQLRLALSIALLLALAGLWWSGRGRQSLAVAVALQLGKRVRHWWEALWRPVWQLDPAERALAATLLAVVVLARFYYAGYYPLSLDEIASYDYFVLPGAAVTASYYSFPNNHILANLLVGLVHGLLPGASPTLALRLLPTLSGVLTLPIVYALMLRYLRFGVATLGLGLYWLSPLGVYYAVAGRGYAWAMVAALGGLFATAELLRPGTRRTTRQLAWAVFGLSGVLGLYAVPTHLYALLGLGVALLLQAARAPARVRCIKLRQLALATLGVALVSTVLYAPVEAVSGWAALLANPYVARHEWPEFQFGIGPWLVGTATELLGQRGLSAAVYCLVLWLAPVALCWGRVPQPTRRLGWVLWLQVGLWLPVVLGQRVYPPARTLLLVLLAFFLLVAILGQAAWTSGPGVVKSVGALIYKLRLLVLLVVLGAYGGYRLHREQTIIQQLTRQQQELRQVYAWLRSQPLRRIWVEPRAYALCWHHYALSAGQRPLPLVVPYDALTASPGAAGEVEVLKPGQYEAAARRPARYRSAGVLVVPVSPTEHVIKD